MHIYIYICIYAQKISLNGMHEVETASEAVLKLQVLLDKADGITPSAIRQMQVLKFIGFTSTKVQILTQQKLATLQALFDESRYSIHWHY